MFRRMICAVVGGLLGISLWTLPACHAPESAPRMILTGTRAPGPDRRMVAHRNIKGHWYHVMTSD